MNQLVFFNWVYNCQIHYQIITRFSGCCRRASADFLYGPPAVLQRLRSLSVEWPTSAVGHNPPVGVAIQFQWIGRRAALANGSYSPGKLTSSLPRPGHNQP
jgi:hypothetical protein